MPKPPPEPVQTAPHCLDPAGPGTAPSDQNAAAPAASSTAPQDPLQPDGGDALSGPQMVTLQVPRTRIHVIAEAFARTLHHTLVAPKLITGPEDLLVFRLAQEGRRWIVELPDLDQDFNDLFHRACAAAVAALDPNAPAAGHPEHPGISEEQWAVLAPLISASCEDLFSAYGVALHPLPEGASAEPGDLAARIGLISDDLNGTMNIAAPPEVTARIGGAGAEHEEWLVELANQLLGRLKNKLLPYGIALYPSTPVCQRRGDPARRRVPARHFVFDADPGGVLIEFCCTLPQSFVFPTFPLLDSGALGEGEMLLF